MHSQTYIMICFLRFAKHAEYESLTFNVIISSCNPPLHATDALHVAECGATRDACVSRESRHDHRSCLGSFYLLSTHRVNAAHREPRGTAT